METVTKTEMIERIEILRKRANQHLKDIMEVKTSLDEGKPDFDINDFNELEKEIRSNLDELHLLDHCAECIEDENSQINIRNIRVDLERALAKIIFIYVVML